MNSHAHTRPSRVAGLAVTLLLGACASTPEPSAPAEELVARVVEDAAPADLSASTAVAPAADADAPRAPASSRIAPGVASTSTFGTSVEGRPLRVMTRGHGAEVVLFVATIHGDEWAGTPLLESFGTWLDAHPEATDGRTVVLVPVVNPDGYARRTRHNARGVDLNRNFPADNRVDSRRSGARELSEPEAEALAALVDNWSPARIVSIHQPVGCVDYDGPAASIAQAVADACALPVTKLGARPGSLGSWVGLSRQTPILTLELPRHAERETAQSLWERYGEALRLVVAGVDHEPRS